MEQLSDEDLVARYRENGQNSHSDPFLNELFLRHHRKVALWCLRFTGDREKAADLAQEILASAYRHLDSFQGNSKFSTWLYAISRNHCLNELKARSSRPLENSEPLLVEPESASSQSILDLLEQESAAKLARQLITESLDETEQKVFTLHYAEDMPLDAITRLLRLSNASGAKAYIVSAKRKLQVAVRRWRARDEATR